MALQAVTYQFKGMNRDLSNINANQQFAYEIRNMKITPDNDNTLLSINSVKGHRKTNVVLKGTPIGHAVINDKWIIFCAGPEVEKIELSIPQQEEEIDIIYPKKPTEELPYITTEKRDYIYLLTKKENSKDLNCSCVEGVLNFSTEFPLETITYVENEKLEKIYWTDGLNQLRFITTDRLLDNSRITAADVDFIPVIRQSSEYLNITKDSSILGVFTPGTTQYAFTYINKYGQQSNIFKTSSLFYNTDIDRGLNVDRTSTDSYKIQLQNLNNSDYTHVRIYSIVRPANNTIPEVRVVKDINIEKEGNLTYVDRHTEGYVIDPTELFYVGGEQLIVETLTQKNNTLFLGNIKKLNTIIPEDIVNSLQIDNSITFFHDNNKIIKETAGQKPYFHEFQLNNPSEKITTFKHDDYYRFGVQFLHNSGKWSAPIRITDACNDKYPISEIDKSGTFHTHTLVSAEFNLGEHKEIITALRKLGYIKARPVIVYPSFYDRKVLCQGYLSPTVYNAGERLNNGAFAQSSWFARPWFKDKFVAEGKQEDANGAVLEFRHNHIISGVHTAHQELQSGYSGIDYADADPETIPCSILNKDDQYNKEGVWEKRFSQHYYVDSSIVTMHSPEIEFDDSLKVVDLDKYKFRIIGYVPLTGFQGDVDIITSSIYRTLEEAKMELSATEEDGGEDLNYLNIVTGAAGYDNLGFYKKIKKSSNYSKFGSRILCSGVFYRDSYSYFKKGDKEDGYKLPLYENGTFKAYTKYYSTVQEEFKDLHKQYVFSHLISVMGYNIYPFHANGSISNIKDRSVLQYKKLSNVRYSYGNFYSDNLLMNTYSKNIFYSDQDQPIMIKTYNDKELFYKGNVDTIITGITHDNEGNNENGVIIFGSPQMSIEDTGKEEMVDGDGIDRYKCKIYNYYSLTEEEANKIPIAREHVTRTTQPIVMRYKSTPHVVLSLKSDKSNTQQLLPLVNADNYAVNWMPNNPNKFYLFWDNVKSENKITYYDENNNYITDVKYSGLWLGELYQEFSEDFIKNSLFGGNTQQAVSNNTWLVAGQDVRLNENSVLSYTEGDTYYQRYNNLKTYPWSLEEVNGITDVISFMVETRINLDGRYDNNTPTKAHFHIFPDNFNLINNGYTQNNNFFSYYGNDYSLIQLNSYPNLISWSKTKTSGEIIDTWVNLNLSSTLELDGNNGKVTSLQNYNDNIIAFQEKGINQILYNEQTQISTAQGVPIEIANSEKVSGYRSLYNTVGCTNKWSICKTPAGLYFLDSYNKDLYTIADGLKSISTQNGFSTYIKNIKNLNKPWNNKDCDNIKTSYDSINKEVLFSIKNNEYETLAYSEYLDQFSSFYDFKTSYLSNLSGDQYIIGNTVYNDQDAETTIWGYQQLDKHSIFEDIKKPYYIEFISNPNPLNDKIFNTLEFRSDSYLSNGELQNFKTFDKLTVSNEYQNNSVELKYTNYGLSTLKKKFRIWKAQMPRDKVKYDRIRNTWTKIKLESTENNDDLNTVLHDITVHYSM